MPDLADDVVSVPVRVLVASGAQRSLDLLAVPLLCCFSPTLDCELFEGRDLPIYLSVPSTEHMSRTYYLLSNIK